jgi:hypothetical protein
MLATLLWFYRNWKQQSGAVEFQQEAEHGRATSARQL